jgi:AcrR family transcriptional regulator
MGSRNRSDRQHAKGGPPARDLIPRGTQARQRVLRAALEVLAERGLAGFTMEAVARQAGASKATVYRRWTSSGALLIDAMDAAFQPFPVPATGQLRADVIELLSRLVALLTDSPFPRLMAAFIDAAERDPALASLHADLTHRRRQGLLQLLQAARGREEISPSTDLELAVDLFTAPFFYHRFIAHRPFPPGMVTAVVDHVLTAIEHVPAPLDGPRQG